MPDPLTPFRAFGIGGRSTMDAVADGDPITSIDDFGPDDVPITPNNASLSITGGHRGFKTNFDFAGFFLSNPASLHTYNKGMAGVFVLTKEGAEFSGGLLYNGNIASYNANFPNAVSVSADYAASGEGQLSGRNTLPSTGTVAIGYRRNPVTDGLDVSGTACYGWSKHTLWSHEDEPVTRYLLRTADMASENWNIQLNGHTNLFDAQIFLWDRADPGLTNQQITDEMVYAASLYGGNLIPDDDPGLEEGYRFFFAGDSRTDGKSGANGLDTYFNKTAEAIDAALGVRCRHYNGGVFGAQAYEGVRRVANILGSEPDDIASQLAVGAGTLNVLIIGPFGINGLHGTPGSAASQWDSVVQLGQEFLAGCMAQGAAGRVVVCTEVKCITSYASDADMVAFSDLAKANYTDISADTLLADLTSDSVLNDLATWNSGSTSNTEDGVHWKPPINQRVADIVAPQAIVQAQALIIGDDESPTVTDATINGSGDTLDIVFSEEIADGTLDGFVLSGGATLGNGTLAEDSLSAEFSITPPVSIGQVRTLSYSGSEVEDIAGNPLESFSGASVTNNSTLPSGSQDLLPGTSNILGPLAVAIRAGALGRATAGFGMRGRR